MCRIMVANSPKRPRATVEEAVFKLKTEYPLFDLAAAFAVRCMAMNCATITLEVESVARVLALDDDRDL